jgi:hypothetical protein
MKSIVLLIGVVAIGAVLYFYSKSQNKGKNLKSVVVKDPQAAILYKQNKQKEEKKLSLKERIELSWQFLYDITEIVLNKFSAADRQEVHDIGAKLSKTGMKYKHVVALGISHEASRAPSVNIEQGKSAGKSR